MLGFLRRSMGPRKEDSIANAYFIMVRSNLEYRSSVWNSHHKDPVHKLKMVQRRVAPTGTEIPAVFLPCSTIFSGSH